VEILNPGHILWNNQPLRISNFSLGNSILENQYMNAGLTSSALGSQGSSLMFTESELGILALVGCTILELAHRSLKSLVVSVQSYVFSELFHLPFCFSSAERRFFEKLAKVDNVFKYNICCNLKRGWLKEMDNGPFCPLLESSIVFTLFIIHHSTLRANVSFIKHLILSILL
jgi:hypothetical protein